MLKLKLIVASVIAMLSVAALGASMADAAFTLTTVSCSGGTVITACYATTLKGATLFEFSGEEEILGVNVPIATHEILLQATLGESEVHIVCTGSTSQGTLVQPANLTGPASLKAGTITFTGCTLLEPLGKKCKVPTTLTTKAITGKLETASDVVYKPETGTIFIGINFTNNGTETCPATVKGLQPVTGTQLCEASSITEVEEDLAEHTQICNETGSSLKLGGSAATFLMSQTLKLDNIGTDFWSISSSG